MDLNRGNIDSPNTWTRTEAKLTPIKTYTLIWTEVAMTPDMKSSNIATPKKPIHSLLFMTRLVIYAFPVGEPLVCSTVYDFRLHVSNICLH